MPAKRPKPRIPFRIVADVKLRSFNILRFTTGLSVVNSRHMNRARPMMAVTPKYLIKSDPSQSFSLPLSRTTWRAPRPTARKKSPATSSLPFSRIR